MLGGILIAAAADPYWSCCLVWNVRNREFGSAVYLGGTLVISANHVIANDAQYRVSIPCVHINDRNENSYAVREIIRHESADLCFLILETELQLQPAPRLATTEEFLAAMSPKSDVILCGFGAAWNPPQNPEDQSGAKRVDEHLFAISFTETEFTAGGKGPDGKYHDACRADSGGPVYIRDATGALILIGIASRGLTPTSGDGGIYTRVDTLRGTIVIGGSSTGARDRLRFGIAGAVTKSSRQSSCTPLDTSSRLEL